VVALLKRIILICFAKLVKMNDHGGRQSPQGQNPLLVEKEEYFMTMSNKAEPKTDVKVKLIGEDGNAFYILGKVCKALRDAGYGFHFRGKPSKCHPNHNPLAVSEIRTSQDTLPGYN
jgi:hypothetical protein